MLRYKLQWNANFLKPKLKLNNKSKRKSQAYLVEVATIILSAAIVLTDINLDFSAKTWPLVTFSQECQVYQKIMSWQCMMFNDDYYKLCALTAESETVFVSILIFLLEQHENICLAKNLLMRCSWGYIVCIVQIWSSWLHCQAVITWFIKIHNGLPSLCAGWPRLFWKWHR